MTSLHSSTLQHALVRAAAPTQADPVRARRRRALLQLARRRGEVRVALRDGGALVPHAADVLDLLDELNTAGRLTYAGLQGAPESAEFVYRQA